MNAPQPPIPAAPPSIGLHVLLDLFEVNDPRLADADALCELLTRHLDQTGFHRLASNAHQFPGAGAGATVMVMLSESHATIHTYPEFRYAALDVFSCGDADVHGFVDAIVDELKPGRVERHDQQRGHTETQR